MRKILEIPPINENDIDKVSKVIDRRICGVLGVD